MNVQGQSAPEPTTQSAVSVLIADDHAPTRADISRALGADPRFRVCAEAGDGQAADLLSRLCAVPEAADVAQLGQLLPC